MNENYYIIAIAFLAIVALILLISHVLQIRRARHLAIEDRIEVKQSISIGSKEKIVLVEVNKTKLLLGSTPNQIQLLHILKTDMAHPGMFNNNEDFLTLEETIKNSR